MDGWGFYRDWTFNAVTRSGLINYPGWLSRYPWLKLRASGPAVGLPEGQMGNSEVGHLDRKSTRLNSSHTDISRMPSSA